MRNTLGAIVLGLGLAVGLMACHGANTTHHVTAAQSQQAKADAKQLTKCLPKNTVAQLRLAKTLGTKSGRANLVATCGIPKANKERFEAEVLQGAESGHLTTKAGRAQFFEVTLPGVVARNQA